MVMYFQLLIHLVTQIGLSKFMIAKAKELSQITPGEDATNILEKIKKQIKNASRELKLYNDRYRVYKKFLRSYNEYSSDENNKQIEMEKMFLNWVSGIFMSCHITNFEHNSLLLEELMVKHTTLIYLESMVNLLN
jgi:hypothetical protein